MPILAEYEEVETAKRETLENRPALSQAVAHAKRARAILVIARLDRLARNVLVTSQLLESGVEFVACDNPYANRMTIQIIAVMAENESRLISERTKAALAARKARGLTNTAGRRFSAEEAKRGQRAAALSHRRRARDAYRDVAPSVVRMRNDGVILRDIVRYLEDDGQRNQYGRPFDLQCVRRILIREGTAMLPPFLARDDARANTIRSRGVAAARATLLQRVKAARDIARPIACKLYAWGRHAAVSPST